METEKEAPKKVNVAKEIRDWALVLIAAVVITLVLRNFICDFPIVDGNSMQETLQNGERMAVTKIDFLWDPPKRGEVVVCYYPNNAYEGLLVKRIVAIGGDTVGIENGNLVVNGEIIDEPYIEHAPQVDFGPYVVPEDQYFVMGDNRPNSLDSRMVGALPRNLIEGRVHAVFWPLNALRGIEKYDNYPAFE